MPNVVITPASGAVDFYDNSNILFGRAYMTGAGNFMLSSENGKLLRLNRQGGAVYIGDGTTASDVVFEQSGKVRALAGRVLTIGQQDSAVAFDTKSFSFVGGGTFLGEYDAGADGSTYNNALAALTGGTNRGTLVKGRLGGHIVLALHGDDDNDAVFVTSYTTDATPSHATAPNKTLLRLNRQGQLTLGNYASGILAVDGSGIVSAVGTLSVFNGGTGRNSAPTANKFIIYDAAALRFAASAFDENSFTRHDRHETVSGNWTFTGTVTANIQASATATTADRWSTPRTISFAGGHINGSFSIDGSANVGPVNLSLVAAGTPGTYKSVTTDTYGRVTAGSNPSTLAGFGITDAMPRLYNVGTTTPGTYNFLGDRAESLLATTGASVGAVKITLPKSWSDSHILLRLKVWQVGSANYSELVLGGRLDSGAGAWQQAFVAVNGNPNQLVTIKFGHDGTRAAIVIGNTGNSWSSLRVQLDDVFVSGSNQQGWEAGYALALITSETGLTYTATPNIAGGTNADTLDNLDSTYFLNFGNLTNKPTTLAGYGITDGVSATAVNTFTGNITIGSGSGAATRLYLPSGTNTTPSLARTGDEDTGLYFPATGSVGLAVDGSLMLDVVAGRARIGTGATLLNQISLQTNLSGTQIQGAAISVGGEWDNGSTFSTTSGANSNNGAVSLLLGTGNTTAKFAIRRQYTTVASQLQININPDTLFEVYSPSADSVAAANYVRLTATAAGTGPLLQTLGTDANVEFRLQAKGVASINMLSRLYLSANLETGASSLVALGSSPTTNVRLRLTPVALNVTGAGSNSFSTLFITQPAMSIAAGIGDAGTRSGMQLDWIITDPNFLGSLTTSIGIYLRHGTGAGSGAGTITANYGLYVEGSAGGAATVTNSWGIYQVSGNANTKNSLGNKLLIGATTGDTASELLYVAGAARFTGVVNLGARPVFSAGMSLTGPAVEYADGGGIAHYRNVAEFNSASSGATGTIMVTLPKGWSDTALSITLLVGELGARGFSKIRISGLPSSTSSAWTNVVVAADAAFGANNSLRLAYNGSNAVILIGGTTSTWAYPKVFVAEVLAAQSNITGWDTGWAIALTTSETGLTAINSPPVAVLGASSATSATDPSYTTVTASGNIVSTSGSFFAQGGFYSRAYNTTGFSFPSASNISAAGSLAVSGNFTASGGVLTLNNGTANMLMFGTAGSAAPTLTTRSAGTKIVLYPGVSGSSVDHAIGIEGSTHWVSVPTTGHFFRWYAATTQVMEITGAGVLAVLGGATFGGGLTVSSGGASISGALTASGLITGQAVVAGTPTGGNMGVGTINATGIYVNGAAVGTGAVTSVAGRTGAVTLSTSDISGLNSYAQLASPTFTGTPSAPTATGGTNSTQVATTAFVQTALSGALSGYASLNSPTFTGAPSAPHPATGTNNNQIATTAFVQTAVSNASAGVGSIVTSMAQSGYVQIASGTTAQRILVSDFAKYLFTTVRSTSSSFTVSSSDHNSTILCTNSGDITITVPAGLTVGTTVEIIQQGAGQLIFAPGTSATLQSLNSWRTTAGQYSGVRLKCVSSNTWNLIGTID